MSDLVLKGAAHVTVAQSRLVDELSRYAQNVVERARREQSGQDMVEYAGVLVLVAAIIAAMFKFAPTLTTQISKGVTTEVGNIFGHSTK